MAVVRHFAFCGANFGMTYNENLVVVITVQNLVGIALVLLIIQKFVFCTFGLKTLIHAPFGAVFWGKNKGKWKLSAWLSL